MAPCGRLYLSRVCIHASALVIWLVFMIWYCPWFFLFFFQAEDGIRDLVRSRGLGDVYKRQAHPVRPGRRWLGHRLGGLRHAQLARPGGHGALPALSLIHI